MAHEKDRELLEKFRNFVNDDCDLDYLDHSYIDMFLSILPEEKEELPTKIMNAIDIDNKKIVLDGCMVTVSNIVVNLYNPDPNTIFIEDIAHGLANNCRWNGHTQEFWSVAQHCCMMYDNAPKARKLTFLMHDAEEAYWGDMIKPLKNKIQVACPEIINLMHLMRHIIFKKFGIDEESEDSKGHDFELLKWEFENIIKNSNADFWLPDRAKAEWLSRFYNSFNPSK